MVVRVQSLLNENKEKGEMWKIQVDTWPSPVTVPTGGAHSVVTYCHVAV